MTFLFRPLVHVNQPNTAQLRFMEFAEEINENYLFHGTNPESAQCIARDFFRMERAGSSAGSMFGPGIYLAENASKSDECLRLIYF